MVALFWKHRHFWRAVSAAVYLFLWAMCLAWIAKGPVVQLFFEFKTTNVYDTVKRADLPEGFEPVPSVTVCKFPGSQFMYNLDPQVIAKTFNESGHRNVTRFFADWFLTDPDQLVARVGPYKDFNSYGKNQVPANETFRPFLSDMLFVGFCQTIDSDVVKRILPSLADPEEGGTGYLELRFVTDLTDDLAHNYIVYVHQQGDELMSSGLLDQSLSPGAAVSVEEGKMTTATVEGEFVEGLHLCNKTDGLLSECVTKWIESYPGFNCREDERDICDFVRISTRTNEITRLKFEGTQTILNTTGCQLPCRRFAYKMSKSISGDAAHMPEKTGIFIKIKIKKHIDRTKTIDSYVWSTFVSDIGGFTGLFMGASAWTFYEAIIRLGRDFFAKKRSKRHQDEVGQLD